MIIDKIANELNVANGQVKAAVSLLDEGSTVPFIARYRKEATQGLDDAQLRLLQQRLTYLRDMHERRDVILRTIDEQGKLSPVLKQQILGAENKTELEDLYLPYKPKRRTKGQIAIEAGLEPLADQLLSNEQTIPEEAALAFVNAEKKVVDVKAALDGAKFIVIERFAEDAALLQKVRRYLQDNGHISSKLAKGKEQEGVKYKDYFAHSERLNKVPSHRALAMFRGRNEGILQVSLNADPEHEDKQKSSHCEHIIAQHNNIEFHGQATESWLRSVVQWSWRVKIMLHMENELFNAVRERAEEQAINVFSKNLKDLLMAAPAGAKTTMGLDPGLRTGVKVAIVDATGKVLTTATIFPHAPQNQWDKSARTLVNLCKQHKVELISIGNGTASRETDKLAAEVIKLCENPKLNKIMVSESGASVYSASELASQEFPEMDVSLRGAVSIARRLQDPLAELVKIEPKAIGVGQYQHDVSQSQLGQSLNLVIEDCVNAVGVDLNMASAPLLSHVSGLNKTLAQNVVAYRDKHGAFNNRKDILKVERLGPKAFEQSAGFLRVNNGEEPLDASSVHPEAYGLVKRIAQQAKIDVKALINSLDTLKTIKAEEFVDDKFGLPTITDILQELEKPGRDPRPEFKTATFKEGVNTLSDLKVGMILEGVVSNVANFGAFVDVGVHQDGLVHISAMTNKFISDPREVVKAGDIVKVKVMEVDVERKRVSFTMRLEQEPSSASKANHQDKQKVSRQHANKPAGKKSFGPKNAALGNAFADAFANAKKK